MLIRPRTDTTTLVPHERRLQPLPHEFFARPALVVARALIGKCLVRELDGGERVVWPITETEAYTGAHDLACHGRFGETPRTAVMFGPAGVWYVYFIYGMYWMLNVVTDTPGHPAAVLIRGAGPANGPGKLTKQLGITRAENGLAVDPSSKLWLADAGLRVPRREVVRTPRIGVDYAGEWRDKRYRFVWVEN
jgi:DNA-3-methyladenine glycosylase